MSALVIARRGAHEWKHAIPARTHDAGSAGMAAGETRLVDVPKMLLAGHPIPATRVEATRHREAPSRQSLPDGVCVFARSATAQAEACALRDRRSAVRVRPHMKEQRMKQEEMAPADLAKMTVLYTIPGVEEVTVRRDVPYRDDESASLAMDVYYPPGRLPAAFAAPAVLDRVRILGCRPAQRRSDERSRRWAHGVLGEADRRVGDGRDSLLESRSGRGRGSRPAITFANTRRALASTKRGSACGPDPQTSRSRCGS